MIVFGKQPVCWQSGAGSKDTSARNKGADSNGGPAAAARVVGELAAAELCSGQIKYECKARQTEGPLTEAIISAETQPLDWRAVIIMVLVGPLRATERLAEAR